MGSVFRAYDSVLGRMVAIKLLAEGYADDERAVRRFLREARAAARLSGHPHVITIYDVGDAGGRPYLVMEHPGRRHGGRCAADRGRVPRPCPALDSEAALALDHAHSLGVLHRDVKPANMLLSRDRVLHLADFGIARLAAEHAITSVNEMLGTAAYMSPEQTRGEPATEASDRYALAVAAYELLVGERPFRADHFAALAREHQQAPRPSASAGNPRLPRRSTRYSPAGWLCVPRTAGARPRRSPRRCGRRCPRAPARRSVPHAGDASQSQPRAIRGTIRPVPSSRLLALAALAAASLALGALLGAGPAAAPAPESVDPGSRPRPGRPAPDLKPKAGRAGSRGEARPGGDPAAARR